MIEQENDPAEDREMYEKWMAGNPTGFSGLYEKYKNRVFGFLVRMTSDREVAEDLLQETFLAALRNAAQYDETRSFLSWVFGIAHKRAIDYFRHVKVENDHWDDAERSVGSRLDSAEKIIDNKMIRRLVGDAVETLDPAQREVFLLRELSGVPFKDIARIMDCPLNTALGRMRLALQNIRRELQKRGVEGVH